VARRQRQGLAAAGRVGGPGGGAPRIAVTLI